MSKALVMLITILFIRAFVLGKALVGQIIGQAFTLSPVLLVQISESLPESLCLSRDPEQQPWMGWSCSPGCCHTVTEAIPLTVWLSLSCHLSSDKTRRAALQSHAGSLAAQCRALTTQTPGIPNPCYPGLLSAA